MLGFVSDLGAAGAAMREAFPSLERLADVLVLARSGQVSRGGEAGKYSYLVHGAGCRMTGPGGIDIDVDFVDAAEVFDFWRLRCYGQSLPAPVDPTDEELRVAVESLGDLLAEVRPGWFTVSDSHEGRAGPAFLAPDSAGLPFVAAQDLSALCPDRLGLVPFGEEQEAQELHEASRHEDLLALYEKHHPSHLQIG